jgi:hypothetical protein
MSIEQELARVNGRRQKPQIGIGSSLVVLLSGPPGAGKDFIPQLVLEHFQGESHSHVEAVRRANYEAFGIESHGLSLEYMQEHKNEPMEILGGRTWRDTVIQTSEVYHMAYGRGFWAIATISKIQAAEDAVLQAASNPCLFFVTDMNSPEQVEEYEKAFPNSAILVRLHRRDHSFGKYPGFEKAYGANTGKDSRNWLFSDKIPSIDFVNGGTPEQLCSDFVKMLSKRVGISHLARTYYQSPRFGREYHTSQDDVYTEPFPTPHEIYWPITSYQQGKTVAERFNELPFDTKVKFLLTQTPVISELTMTEEFNKELQSYLYELGSSVGKSAMTGVLAGALIHATLKMKGAKDFIWKEGKMEKT